MPERRWKIEETYSLPGEKNAVLRVTKVNASWLNGQSTFDSIIVHVADQRQPGCTSYMTKGEHLSILTPRGVAYQLRFENGAPVMLRGAERDVARGAWADRLEHEGK